MRLDKMRDAELAKRKGQTRRTVIQLIWLGISFAVAYMGVQFFILAPETGLFTLNQIYGVLGTNPNEVPAWAIQVGMMVVIVFLMQIIFFVGFFFASAEGRHKPGKGSLYSRNKDPMDNFND